METILYAFACLLIGASFLSLFALAIMIWVFIDGSKSLDSVNYRLKALHKKEVIKLVLLSLVVISTIIVSINDISHKNVWDIIGISFFLGVAPSLYYYFYAVDKIDEEEKRIKEDVVEATEAREKEIVESKNKEIMEEQNKKNREFHKIDKVIASTNDKFNISMYDEFSKNFIQAWVKYKLDELKIDEMASDLYSDDFSKVQAQTLIGHCELVARAVYKEWYRGYNPPLYFDTINDRAKKTGGENKRFDNLSYLENYLHSLLKSMLESIKISAEIRGEFQYIDQYSVNAKSYIDRRSTNNGVLRSKINFLLISVFFMNREGVHIKHRKADRKSKYEDARGLIQDIEKVKESIAQHGDFYPGIKKAYQHNEEVARWLEEQMDKINFSDENYIEKCNRLMERAKEKLNYDFI